MTQVKVKASVDRCASSDAGAWTLPRRVGGWDLIELAAEGSLAQVYRGRPAGNQPDRPGGYAVKVLRREWQEDPRAVGSLRREATVGQSVSHPHLVSVLAAGVRRPPCFVVMPWLEGSTLAQHLADQGHFEPPAALWVARQVAEALDGLRSAGWMHGDVKPANIFLSPQGHVTLIDLGFARRDDETGSVLERGVTGTCNYIAPEMITSACRWDARSDIYSLGVVLFQLLSGRLPFESDNLAEVAARHRQARPPDLRRLVPHLPGDVVRLVRQMLAKTPLRRPQTPRELIARLTALEIATFAQRAL